MRLFVKPSMNWLFVFVPVAVLLEHVEGIPVPLIFFSAALAILPIAGIIVKATEQIGLRVGDTIGGLLNATFGNAPELIISIVALRAGLFDMVRASLAGAVLANLLLALGVAFLLGGIRYHEQEYNPVASRVYSTMMLLAVISLSIPSGFRRVLGGDEPMAYEQSLNLGIALALLFAYLLNLLFMLKTHPDLFKSVGGAEQHHTEGERWSVGRAVITLVAGDGRSHWFKGVQLITLYLVIAMMFYFLPAGH
jgi:Ca2+:H+ antiporter